MPIINTSGFFVPAQMSGCVLWLDGTDPAGTGVAPSTGATVSTWNDKSVSAKHGTSGGTPTYVAGGGVNFNGTSFFYNLSFAQNLSQRSIFIVMQETTHTGTKGVFPLIPNPSTGQDWTTTTGMTIETSNGLVHKEKKHITKDSQANLIILCEKCHDSLHAGKVEIKSKIKTTKGTKVLTA